MKKSLYYRTVYSRPNPIKSFLSDLFFDACSYPRLLLEVFIRKNFGERYFSLPTCITLFVILLLLPMTAMLNPWTYFHPSFMDVFLDNVSWYAFAGLFLYCAILRKKEVKRVASEFDFLRFSKSAGHRLPAFENFKINGKLVSLRNVEILIEPAFFFIIGLALLILSQKIGLVLILSSFGYSLSYFIAYWRGDNIILDQIDEIIINNTLFDVFTSKDDRSSKNGFRVFGDRPVNDDLRARVASNLGGEEETFDAI